MKAEIGIIGGSGLYSMPGFEASEEVSIQTPFGDPSDKYVLGTLSGKRVEAVVVGIGINVHTRVFPEELEDRATSVGLVVDAPPDRGVLLADVLEGLDRDMALAADRGLGLVHARLTAADALVGTRVRAEGVEGVARGIDLEGQLVIERDDGVRVRVTSGEVQLS